jgi:hypothetical protein
MAGALGRTSLPSPQDAGAFDRFLEAQGPEAERLSIDFESLLTI